MLYPKKDFSKFTVLQVQNLLAHQKESFDLFQKTALRQVFKEYFPVSDYSDKDLRLEFVDCYFGKPKNTEEEARRVNASYEAPLRVKFRLVNLISKETEDQEIYFGDFPIMTDRGSFIINGNERVIINQLVRSAGVYFTAVQFGERKLFGAKLIPQKGSWLEFQVEPTNMVQVRVNRRKKVPVTVMLKALGVTQKELETMFEGVDNPEVNFIKTTSKRDETKDQEDALLEIHHKLRPFEPNTFDNAQAFFESMFLMEDRYSLSEVGRYKFNQRLNISGVTEQVLRKEDVIAIITELLRLMNDPLADADDMDSLEYRRIRDVSELLGNQARIGVARLVKNIKDRMSTVDKTQKLFPSNVLYPRIFTNSLKEFFNLSPLSQLLDQVNIMSEVEHKRRLTVGGPGGLNKDRAGFEVRDLHPSHYGKICPIQTPEGSSIGLVLYRALYSRKNDFGFLETPYYKVEKGRVTDVLEYIDTKKEKLSIIASANVMLDKKKMIMGDEIEARINNEPSLVSKDQVDYMEVSPFQIFSASTSKTSSPPYSPACSSGWNGT
ncbi:MAG: DNA-directed RNA polymerase subunit beta [Parcubacteria group bacterium GW2011_GWC1_41_7]|nr:MAG: DNA-directed RNA polymerase subunit beta [Parcubacteria group bacterium GW2011_GWC1_41_7]